MCRASSCWYLAAVCALAALAGVIGGNAFVTEPGMAGAVGSIIFVVVISAVSVRWPARSLPRC